MPRPDLVIFLYLPYEEVRILKEKRDGPSNINILRLAETAYLELAEIYEYQKINCFKDNKFRTIEDISNEIITKVSKFLETDV